MMPVCAPPLQAVAAALRGVEPLQPGPKPGVLPLDDRAMWYCAPVAGFEPTTRRLTAGCSATELYGKGCGWGTVWGPAPVAWRRREDSNLHLAVLETAALPVKLRPLVLALLCRVGPGWGPCGRQDSNLRRQPPEGCALSTELRPRYGPTQGWAWHWWRDSNPRYTALETAALTTELHQQVCRSLGLTPVCPSAAAEGGRVELLRG